MAALSDVNEIKVLGFMLLLRLGQLAPAAVTPRLDEVVSSLQDTMKGIEVKEDTIKQDLERKGPSSHLILTVLCRLLLSERNVSSEAET